MAMRLQTRDGTFSDEAKQSTDSIKRLRYIVLGSDETLIKEACDTILMSKYIINSTKQGTCEIREACVSGRHVSVVQMHAYWLENLKTYFSHSDRVRSMKRDMEVCYSLVFPGPHAFLLVLGDPRNSGKEHYILRALSEEFGREVLDYCKVLILHGYRDSEIVRNRCVRKCGKRFHILKENEDNVLKLFNETTGTMIKQRKPNFFTKDLELLDKAETYFKKESNAKYEERESRLRGDLAEMKTTEENLRTKMTEMEKQNSKNSGELQDLRKEVDALRARENQLHQQMDALKKKKYELKEELYALRYYKRRMDVELTASSEGESQLKSEYEEQLKGSEKKLENNPRESKDGPIEELEHNRLQEQKEAQARAQEEHDRPRTSDRREVDLDKGKRKLLQTVTGSQHGHQISTAVTPPSVSENKVKPLSEIEYEMKSKTIDSQSSRSIKGEEGVKLARQNSIKDRPNLSEDKETPQEDTGYLEFEGLKLVRENVKALDPPDDGSESNLHMSVL